jgi:methionyl-tRNA synthetase
MLKSIEVEAPKQILVHGMIMSGGVKMSKTIGNVISPQETLQTYNSLADKSLLGENVGSEFFRYFVLKNISPFSDGDVTMERMQELYNADLANGIGNLVNRVMKLCSMYFEEGYRPEPTDFPKEYTEAMEKYDVKSAFEYIFKVVSEADLYMQTNQPFKVVKEDLKKGKEMLQHLRTQVYIVGRLLNPFMPKTSELIKSLVQSNQMPEKPLFPKYE